MDEQQQPTVFIVESDPAVRQKLREVLDSIRLPVETYRTPADYLRSYQASRPGCLIVGVRLPEMSGLELFRRLREKGEMMPVIFVTEHGDVPTAVEAMRQGAFDFLQTPLSDQYLLDRVNAAIRKNSRDRRNAAERTAAAARFQELSARERTVLELVKEGRMSKQIARELGVSIKTVEFHRSNIMRKVGVDTIAGLIHLYLLAELQNHR